MPVGFGQSSSQWLVPNAARPVAVHSADTDVRLAREVPECVYIKIPSSSATASGKHLPLGVSGSGHMEWAFSPTPRGVAIQILLP